MLRTEAMSRTPVISDSPDRQQWQLRPLERHAVRQRSGILVALSNIMSRLTASPSIHRRALGLATLLQLLALPGCATDPSDPDARLPATAGAAGKAGAAAGNAGAYNHSECCRRIRGGDRRQRRSCSHGNGRNWSQRWLRVYCDVRGGRLGDIERRRYGGERWRDRVWWRHRRGRRRVDLHCDDSLAFGWFQREYELVDPGWLRRNQPFGIAGWSCRWFLVQSELAGMVR